VCGWQVKLCDPLVTHGPYLSPELHHKALYKFTLLYTWVGYSMGTTGLSGVGLLFNLMGSYWKTLLSMGYSRV